ncbi:hypothetical protein EBV26_04985 [bacterium]|nr:hypothetical protein [bacterium]
MSTNRNIENPYWANKEKQHVIAEFYYPDTGKRVTASIMNDGTNRDFDELMRKYSVEQIDANTKKRLDDRNEQIKHNIERQKVDRTRMQQEQLFAAKLDAFEIDSIKASKNRELKSKIRKAKNIMEVTAYTVMLLQQEEANAE